jgi:hypothetical protein
MDEQPGTDIAKKVRRRCGEDIAALVADFRQSGQSLSAFEIDRSG